MLDERFQPIQTMPIHPSPVATNSARHRAKPVTRKAAPPHQARRRPLPDIQDEIQPPAASGISISPIRNPSVPPPQNQQRPHRALPGESGPNQPPKPAAAANGLTGVPNAGNVASQTAKEAGASAPQPQCSHDSRAGPLRLHWGWSAIYRLIQLRYSCPRRRTWTIISGSILTFLAELGLVVQQNNRQLADTLGWVLA